MKAKAALDWLTANFPPIGFIAPRIKLYTDGVKSADASANLRQAGPFTHQS